MKKLKYPKRKQLRLEGFDYNAANAYFTTICAPDKKCIFGKVQDGEMQLNNLGIIVENEIKQLNEHEGIGTESYIVMPNHIHFIAHLNDRYLPHVVRLLKNSAHKSARIVFGENLKLWQRGYFEYVVRNEMEYTVLQEYIRDNPVKWEIDGENPDFPG